MSTLERLARLRGVTWQWKDNAAPFGKTPGAPDAGVIAQDVEAVFPELIVTTEEGYKTVNYTGLVGVLVEAVKELKKRNEELERRVEELERSRDSRVPPR